MKKLYTAVGIMKQKRGEKGMTYPYVVCPQLEDPFRE